MRCERILCNNVRAWATSRRTSLVSGGRGSFSSCKMVCGRMSNCTRKRDAPHTFRRCNLSHNSRTSDSGRRECCSHSQASSSFRRMKSAEMPSRSEISLFSPNQSSIWKAGQTLAGKTCQDT